MDPDLKQMVSKTIKGAEAEMQRKKLTKLLPGFFLGIFYGFIAIAGIISFVSPFIVAITGFTLGWLIVYGAIPRGKPQTSLFAMGLSPGLVLGIAIGMVIIYPNQQQFVEWISVITIGALTSFAYKFSKL
jgi:hypothetical protein